MMTSMNEVLYDDLFVVELEERLETDPLAIGGLFSLFDSSNSAMESSCWWVTDCGSEYHSCIID